MVVATRTTTAFSPALRFLPRSMRLRSVWLTATSVPLTVTVTLSSAAPRSRYAPSCPVHVSGRFTVAVYVPTPEDWLRLTGVRMSRHDGSFPFAPAVMVNAGWSVLVVVYSLAPGVHICALSVHVPSFWDAAMPVTTVVCLTPLDI